MKIKMTVINMSVAARGAGQGNINQVQSSAIACVSTIFNNNKFTFFKAPLLCLIH